jgi:CHAT domain-containing protein/tetratricopeptide (TPR) repeat protein
VGARERSWRQLAEEAELKLEQGDVPEAIALYENAVARLGRRSDRVLRASVLYNLAAAQAQGGRGQEAGTSLRRARDLLRAAPDGHDGALLSTVLSRLGTLELDLGDLGAAREAHEQAIVLRERAGDQQGLPTAYVNLGLTLKDEGRLTEAQAYLSRGLDLASANGLDRVAGHALTGLGLVHELLNELIPATVSYQQALAAYQSAADEENEATIYHNLGVVLDKRGDQERALDYFRRSYDIDVARGDVPGMTASLGAMAGIAQENGHLERAEALHRLVLEHQLAGGYRPAAIDTLCDLAILARDRRDQQASASLLEQALRLAREIGDPREIHEVHLHWGDMYSVAGDWSAARAQYAQAAEAMRIERGRLLGEEDAVAYFDDDRLAAIDRLIVITGEGGDLRACAEWVEQAKGREQARRLVTVPMPPPRNIPSDLAGQEARIAGEARALSARLAGAGAEAARLVRQYEQSERDLRAVWEKIARFDPEFAALRSGAVMSWQDMTATVRRAAASDGRDVLLVQYYVRDEVTIALGVAADREPMLALIPYGAGELRDLRAEYFPRTVPYPSTDGPRWQAAMAPFADPVRDWVRPGDVVYLCPHDVLHRLPLHAVKVDGIPLGERNIVAYVPSAAVLRSCLAQRAEGQRAAVVLGDASGTGSMPFARDEALALAEMFEASGFHATVGVGDQASGQVLRQALGTPPEPGIVHLAVHGSFDSGRPMDSGIHLADGLLTATQAAALPLRAGLVTLSACDSGMSSRRPGDELLGLTRAFVYAGTPAVLVSLWQVDQIATSMLMQSFYRALLSGTAKGAALWQAQLDLRRSTVHDVLRYLGQARERVGSDPRALTAVDLAEATFRLGVGDYLGAGNIHAMLVTRSGLTAGQRRLADRLEKQLPEPGHGERGSPDYAYCPYDSVAHWASFVLIGDWR